MVYPALLPLMRTPRLPLVDGTEGPPPPPDLVGLVRFPESRNLVSERVPSNFKTHCIVSCGSKSPFELQPENGFVQKPKRVANMLL